MVQPHTISGPARVGRRTKELVRRIQPGDVAVIFHRDLDAMAASQLVERRPCAVVNAEASTSGRYVNGGPRVLLEGGIPLFDATDAEWADDIRDGETIRVAGAGVYRGEIRLTRVREVTEATLQAQRAAARDNLETEIAAFAENTLRYLADDKALLLNPTDVPATAVKIDGRPALIVVRGEGYRADLEMVRPYVKEQQPVLIGVDGGADALLECGFTPDILLGDMDSASDDAIRKAGQVIVHAYVDGRAPGLQRVQALGRDVTTFAVPGTSEDAAMLLAYERGASLIVAVGTHFSLEEFLDKGRAGMASTFLVRLRVGARLVDAKGVSRLYGGGIRPRYLLALLAASALPIAIVLLLSSPLSDAVRLLAVKLQFWLWRLRH
ncbi:MAG TPA: putative cytokinetic ring protein SteA [Armatimonadota bacterium]